MTQPILELRLEIEPIKPYKPSTVSTFIKETMDESMSLSNLGKTKLIFEQHLPTPEQLNLVIAILQLVITADPQFLARLKAFLEYLFRKFIQSSVGHVNAKFTIGDKSFEAKNLSVEDTMTIITKEYELILKMRKKD